MAKKTKSNTKNDATTATTQTEATTPKTTRAQTMIAMMRADGGATAAELGAAVGWQRHSVRGFIAGTLKKRADLQVTASRSEGVTHYQVADIAAA